jgi:putative peptidoglycan lipid II flippase
VGGPSGGRRTGAATSVVRTYQAVKEAIVPILSLTAPRALFDRFVPRGAIVMSVLTFGSYLMGLFRDRILTRTFGAGSELDTFHAAFQIPELFFTVIIASGLAAPFIPIFTALKREDGEAAAHEFGRTIFTLALLAMAVVSAVLFIIAPLTVQIAAPGFGPEQRDEYVTLFRIMCGTQILFAGSMALGEVLVAERRFAFFAAAPLMYNLGIVIGTVALADQLGILAPALGVILGASLHLGIRLAGIARTSFRPRPRLAIRTPAFREFLRLMLPKTGSSPIEPLLFLFFTSVASTLAAGSITTVSLARNFMSVPVSLIGVAIAIAAFPVLAATYAAADRPTFIAQIRRSSTTVGVLTVLAAIGLIIVGPTAIGVLLGGGQFDAAAVARTASVLAVFAIAIPFESLGHLLSRAIYATRHTVGQVVASLVGFGVTIVATTLLVGPLDVLAIPAGFTLGVAVRLVLLVVALGGRLRQMPREPVPVG